MEHLSIYASGEFDYCTLCLKTSSETTLVPGDFSDICAAMQVKSWSSRLCMWCAARLRSFQCWRSQARRANALLNAVREEPLSEQDQESYIRQLQDIKKEKYEIQGVYSDAIFKPINCTIIKEENEENTGQFNERLNEDIGDYGPNKVQILSSSLSNESAGETVRCGCEAMYQRVADEALENIELVHLTDQEYAQAHTAALSAERYVNCRYKCERCALGHRSEHLHLAHMRLHDPASGAHRCALCSLRTASPRARRLHEAAHRRRYRCRLCARLSGTRAAAVRHYAARHCDVVFGCGGCALAARRRPPGERERAECPVCRKTFPSRSHLPAHVVSHEQAALESCAECGRIFKKRSLLMKHLKVKHSLLGAKFECNTCDKSYGIKAHLRDHIAWSHSDTPDLVCTTCFRRFRQRSALRRHVKFVHDKAAKVKDKLCDVCGVGFSTVTLMEQHKLRHTGARPHSCPHCARSFRQRAAAQTHLRRKHAALTTGAT